MSDPIVSRLAEIQGRDEALVNAYADALLANNGWPTPASMQRIKDTRAALLSVIEGQREAIEKTLAIHPQVTIADGPDNAFPACDFCAQEWPCATVAALTAPTTEGDAP